MKKELTIIVECQPSGSFHGNHAISFQLEPDHFRAGLYKHGILAGCRLRVPDGVHLGCFQKGFLIAGLPILDSLPELIIVDLSDSANTHLGRHQCSLISAEDRYFFATDPENSTLNAAPLPISLFWRQLGGALYCGPAHFVTGTGPLLGLTC